MKGLAYILILSLGLLSLNRFTDYVDLPGLQMELSCEQDCCCCDFEPGCEDHHKEESQDAEKENKNSGQCTGNCDCSQSIQIASMELPSQDPVELSSLTFDFGSVSELYFFEYQIPHFQPPRVA